MTSDPAMPCLVLLCKRPALGHAKQRLAATLGQHAALSIAQALLACALEDLQQWPGPRAIAPDHVQHLNWARSLAGEALCMAQPDGNLGERLNELDRTLRDQGQRKLIFIGSDCPALRPADYLYVAQLLQRVDTVLFAARDGGVVLMASNRPWPDLSRLPWSTDRLGNALEQLCRRAGHEVVIAGESFDIDHEQDLLPLAAALREDRRPSRRGLRAVLEALGTRHDA
ncbi:DUF2064 domain-containing protein [Pseudomonas sp. KSR10]|uniref:DUF2064 domain-containing protein n=1 Tax=Pseudomonas sp. KSR10 TaxID=2916654 RepID=UPI001EF916F7|nr:DUF2064 domain-containing protein [Pseudomonas sp. KSR10]MCG6538642.1 DUF2064 domain-containing protein [Pseudomonas sp. KSR10]